MLSVHPFRGFRYDPAKVGNLDQCITPPYDVISPEERARLAASSPYNLVHLILPEAARGEDKYAAAGMLIEEWIAAGVLVQDPAPVYTLLRQTFTGLDGQRHVRRGFLAITRLPEHGEHYVLGHERTFDKPVADRLRLTQETRANLGPVFVLYSDPAGNLAPFLAQMEQRPAEYRATTIDGTLQEFWRVPPDTRVNAHLCGKTLYIADGHHRFQTACVYRDEMRRQFPHAKNPPWDYALMGFVALEDPGLAIYPTHRLAPEPEGFSAPRTLDALKEWFEVRAVPHDSIVEALETAPGKCVIALVTDNGAWLLTLQEHDRERLLGTDRGPAWRDLDVAVLHRGILERILGFPEGFAFAYEKSAERAVEAVRRGEAGLAFLLRPTKASQICACAEAGERMPQKSTYFFPKLPSGGVIYRLTE